MVRHALREAIQRVESVACVGGGHDPFVMWFMQGLVYLWMVQAPVDPVNQEIREANEEWEMEVIVEGEGASDGSS